MSFPIHPETVRAFINIMYELREKKNKMISTTPVGTILQVGTTGSFVIKRDADGDAKNLVNILARDGSYGTFMTSQLQVPEAVMSHVAHELNVHLKNYRLKNEKEFKLETTALPPPVLGKSDGSKASYYDLPQGATTLLNLIQHRDMNHSMGEIFCAAYRYGQASHSDKLRDAKKIKFYIEAEIKRLESL